MKLTKLMFVFLTAMALATSCQKDTDVNQVPVVDAGVYKVITLPQDSVSLKGTGSDLDGKVVAYLWSQVSGPSATTIVNPGTDSTLVRGFKEGKYIFQLMVTDNLGATGVDTVSVTVKPSPIKTVTFQPNNNPYEKAIMQMGSQDWSGIGYNEFLIDSWTVNQQQHTGRTIVKFDLSSIPANSTIMNAKFYLYSNTPPENGNKQDANVGSNNAFTIQQVTSDWNPSTVNWFLLPSMATANQIVVPSTTATSLDLEIDVTAMVADMVNTSKNYGFFMKLQNEAVYTSRFFVSSYHPTKTDKHPKLVITYK